MEKIEAILKLISETIDCSISKRDDNVVIDVGYLLPSDLDYYLKNYSSIVLFEHAENPIKIVGLEEFKRANPMIIGEDAEDDISYNWFVIAIGDNSQYITIDLVKERLGRCYDSFWDRHGLVGEQPVIANSFTELLQRLYENKGECYYWLKDDFLNLGDAYD